jgi:hypothetical protein
VRELLKRAYEQGSLSIPHEEVLTVMNRSLLFVVVVFALTTVIIGPAFSKEGSKAVVAYPDGYRDWTHVKSMVIQQGHPLYDAFGGIHHIYANKKALDAMKKGKAYPNGSVIVFDLLEAKPDNNAIVEGSRKVVGVMQKDSKRFAATGGWGFDGFKGDTQERVVKDPKKDCFDCHAPQKDSDYTYSKYRK